MSNFTNECRETLVQCATFKLLQEIVWTFITNKLGIVLISPKLKGGSGPLGYLFGVLLDVFGT